VDERIFFLLLPDGPNKLKAVQRHPVTHSNKARMCQ